jgi:hypothetical protein
VAKVRSPWRLLRPLFLAGAVTATWLTLSSSAATADTSTDSGSLLGGVTSSVSSLTAPLTGVTPPVEAKAPVALADPPAPSATPTGLLQPLAGSLANTTDQVVAAVPVVRSIVPSGTVSTVAVPLATVADGAVAGLVDVAVPPLVEAVPVLEPVVQPVADLVTGATPLPAVLPGVPNASGDLPEALAPDTAAPTTVSAVTGSDGSAHAVPGHAETAVDEVIGSSRPSLAHTGTPATATPGASLRQAATHAPLTEDPSPSPVPAPAAPGSGAGGASPSGVAAWLNDFELDLPFSGTHPITGTSEHAPAPVSFDPGSSPD